LYYDSAIGALPKDFENYEAIKKRQEVLGEFAKYTEAITWNDSLLMLASVDTALLRKQIDSVLAERAKPVASVKKKKRRSYSGESSSSSSSAFFNTDNSNSVDWYFGNPSAIALGQSEFQRVWGVIPLEDNWRRSIKTTVLQETNTTIADVPQPDKPDTEAAAQPQKADEAGKLISQIPRTEADKAKALAQIEEGYFKLGDLFYFQLNEKNNASESYTKLLNRFPQSEYVPEVLYKLYLIAKDTDPAKAEVYAAELKTNHPRSTFTRILINPDYMRETSVAAEKQKLIYKEAYTYFQTNNLRPAQEKHNNLRPAQEKLKQALQEGETSFTPQLELLQILITGKTEDVTRYQFELGEYIKKYPDGELKPYAEQLQAASKTLSEQLQAASKTLLDKLERAKGIQFIKSMEGPHNFIVVYSTSDKITNPVSSAIEKFNATQFKDQKLTTTNIIFNEEKTITIVSELPSQNVALSYFDKFLAQIAPGKPFSNYKFYSFVITKDNFQIFYRTKALDEYLAFFDRNYQKQNQ